jgi:hypothetical protein
MAGIEEASWTHVTSTEHIIRLVSLPHLKYLLI